MNNDNEQLEFDFTQAVCTCTENTRYDDLCPACIQEVHEFMSTAAAEQQGYDEYA